MDSLVALALSFLKEVNVTVKELIQRLMALPQRKSMALPQEVTVLAWSDGNESHAYEVTEIDEEKIETEGIVILSGG